MPQRILRDGILDSRAVSSLSDDGQILYYRLISIVDDYGRYEADIDVVRVKCFPLLLDRWPLSRVSSALTDVSTMRTSDGQELIKIYTVKSKTYLEINNFCQRLRAKTSRCPSSDGHLSDIRQSSAGLVRASPPHSPPIPSPILETRTAVEFAIAECAERMYAGHPKKTDLALIPGALLRAVSGSTQIEDKLIEIESCHGAWAKTEAWTKSNGQYAPRLATWLMDLGFTKWPDGSGPSAKGIPAEYSDPNRYKLGE